MSLVQPPVAALAAATGLGQEGSIPLDSPAQAFIHLAALHTPGTLLELRYKAERGMAQRWFTEPRLAADHAVSVGTHVDCYVGVWPRITHAGGRDALAARCRTVWAECDTEQAKVAALTHTIPPHLVVRSSVGRAHAYWFISEMLAPPWIERANRRLAFRFGADEKACDAARILRVAGTRNHKRKFVERVAITHLDIERGNVDVRALVGDLPDPTPPRHMMQATIRLGQQRPADVDTTNLRAVPARVYVPRLCGRGVHGGLVQCPFHKGGQESTPSLSVGGPNGELWLCFGCDEGGDVFTFAAKLWGMDERSDFPALKTRLKREL